MRSINDVICRMSLSSLFSKRKFFPFCFFILTALSTLLIPSKTVSAITCTSAASGNWNSAGTWAGCYNGFPGANDTAIISSHSVTLTVSTTVVSLILSTPTAASVSLSQNAAASMTVTGSATIYASSSALRCSWNINAATAIVNGLILFNSTRTAVISVSSIAITSGQLDANGGFTFVTSTAPARIISMNNSFGVIRMKGAITAPVDSSSFSATAGSFNYYDTAAQTVSSFSAGGYWNLYLNNTNASGATLGFAITPSMVQSTIAVQSGLFKNGGFGISGNFTQVFSVANNATFEMGGSANPPTSFNLVLSSASIFRYAQSSGVITLGTAAFSNYGNLELKGTGSAIFGFSAVSTYSILGYADIGNGANTLTFSIGGSTSVVFGTMTVNNLATVTMSGNNSFVLKGDFVNYGTFTPTISTVTFESANAQFVRGNPNSFSSIISSNTSLGGLVFTSSFTSQSFLVNTAGLNSSATIYFSGKSTYTIPIFTISGNTLYPVVLRSTDGVNVWYLNNTSTNSVNFAQVSLSSASAGKTIAGYNSTDLGSNTNWTFSSLALPCTSRVSGNWTNYGTWANCSNGFPGPLDTAIISSHTITLDNSVSVASLILSTPTAASVVLNQLSSTTLTVGSSVTIYASSSAIQAGWNIHGGTAVVGGLILFNSTRTASISFSSITINSGQLDANGGFSFVTSTATARVITIQQNTGLIRMKGSISAPVESSSFTANAGSFSFYDNTASQTISSFSANSFFNLYSNNTGGTGATLGFAINATNVRSTFSVQSGTLKNNGLNIAGTNGQTFSVLNGAIFEMSGTSAYPTSFGTYNFGNTSTVRYLQTTSPLTISTAPSYGNLDLKPAGNAVLVFSTGSHSIQGNLTIGDGVNFATVTANSGISPRTIVVVGTVTINSQANFFPSTTTTLFVGGDFLNSGTYTPQISTITFMGLGVNQNLDAGTSALYSVVHSSAGGLFLQNNSLPLTGNLVNNAGWFYGNNEQVIFQGTAGQRYLSATGANFSEILSSNTSTAGLTFSSSFTATKLYVNTSLLGASATVYFSAKSTFTISTFTTNGTSAFAVILNSTDGVNLWYLNNTSSNSVTYTNVSNSSAAVGISVFDSYGLDLGGNTNWFFSGITTAGSGYWYSTVPNAPWPSGTVPTLWNQVIIAAGHIVTSSAPITIGTMTINSTGELDIEASTQAVTLTVVNGSTITNNGIVKVIGSGAFNATLQGSSGKFYFAGNDIDYNNRKLYLGLVVYEPSLVLASGETLELSNSSTFYAFTTQAGSSFIQGANNDLYLTSNTVLANGTFTKATGTGRVFISGFSNLNSGGQNLGDVVIGHSPDYITLQSPLIADHIRVNKLDVLATSGFKVYSKTGIDNFGSIISPDQK